MADYKEGFTTQGKDSQHNQRHTQHNNNSCCCVSRMGPKSVWDLILQAIITINLSQTAVHEWAPKAM